LRLEPLQPGATSEFRDAIYSQPQNLRLASEALADALGEIDLAAFAEGTIVFSGIGASGHAVLPAVMALRAAGRRAVAIPSAAFTDASASTLGDAFVLVSQSGASVETVQALERLQGAPVIAISANAESPLAKAADASLPLGPFVDTAVATLSYTATLQALGMLCDQLVKTSSGWEDLPDLVSDALHRNEAVVNEIAERFLSLSAIDAIGNGGAAASAGEAALLVREGLRLPAAGMETREYLHGPLEAVGAGFGCLVFGGERELELATELSSFGAEVALITDQAAPTNLPVIRISHVPSLVAPVLQIMPVQLLVDQIATCRGAKIGDLRRHQPDTKVA
jgi:glucosamine--fructose-6-phosphate aminotransferase (isomerizing)